MTTVYQLQSFSGTLYDQEVLPFIRLVQLFLTVVVPGGFINSKCDIIYR